MTSQTILKLLALASFLAAIAAIVIWRQTGEPPSPWIIRFSVTAFAAAFVVFVFNQETRPRIMLQFVAALLATVALFAFIADVTAARNAATVFHATPLIDRMHDFAPTLLMSIRGTITRILGATAWDPITTTILSLPAWLVFAGGAAISGFAGRPRREVQIYVN